MSPNAISVIWSSWNWQDYHCGGGYSTGITKTIAMFREEATSILAGFHEGRLSRWNWNLEMLVFLEGFSAENLEKKKTLGATREPTTHSTHIWHWTGIEPRPHSILRHPCPSPHPPSLLPSKYCYDWWNRPRSIYQYSSMAPRLSGQLQIANFSSFFCSSISKKDLDTKKTTPNIEVWPKSLVAMVEY